MKTFLCEEKVLRHDKTNCFPSYLDHYLKALKMPKLRVSVPFHILKLVKFLSFHFLTEA